MKLFILYNMNMDPLTRLFTRAAHGLGIYPHEGKKVVYIRDGELFEGEVIGQSAFCGHTKLKDVTEETLLGILVEAANALNVVPRKIEARLAAGDKVIYRRDREIV